MKYHRGVICGAFDLMHPGYVRMFKDAKNCCDVLLVALQGDPSIDRPHKCVPVQSLESRLEVLSAICYIDEIVTYNTEADLLLILETTPHDVRILGTDYKEKTNFTGSNLNKPIYYHERNHNFSTTSLKEAIYDEMCRFKERSIE